MHRFFSRLHVLPFEEMMAEFVLISGVVGLLGVGTPQDVLTAVIGDWSIAFQSAYAVAGVMMLWGIGTGKANIEAFGLTLLLISVLVRLTVFLYVFGFNEDAWIAVVFNIVIGRACIIRIQSLVRGESIWKLANSTEELQ